MQAELGLSLRMYYYSARRFKQTTWIDMMEMVISSYGTPAELWNIIIQKFNMVNNTLRLQSNLVQNINVFFHQFCTWAFCNRL